MFFEISKILRSLLDPIVPIIILLLILLVRSNLRIKSRLFLTIFVVFVYLGSISPISNRLMNVLENLVPNAKESNKYDSVIVLGGMVNLKNSSNSRIEFSSSVDRIIKGIDLVKLNKAKILVISGGDGSLFPSGLSEAVLLKNFAIKNGIRSELIKIDSVSRNTRSNALNTKGILVQTNSLKNILVTSAFHMYRAKASFKTLNIDVDPYPVDYYTSITNNNHKTHFSLLNFMPSIDSLNLTTKAIQEFIGITVYKIMGYI